MQLLFHGWSSSCVHTCEDFSFVRNVGKINMFSRYFCIDVVVRNLLLHVLFGVKLSWSIIQITYYFGYGNGAIAFFHRIYYGKGCAKLFAKVGGYK
jgi:hypothetical protein